MLRIIVISLVVANILLFGFQLSKPAVQPATATPRTVAGDSNLPTIHLFSELIQDQDLLSGSRQCFSVGPFHTGEEREVVLAQLLEVASTINERQTHASVEKGYWVFMPPYGSLLEANHELLFFQVMGLKDIAVIYEGEWKNAISLGYFLRQENAQKRIKKLKSRGYTPSVLVRRQTEQRYWLDYEQNPGAGLITLDMQDRPNDFMQRPMPCPEQDVLEVADVDVQAPTDDMTQLQLSDTDSGSAGQAAAMVAENSDEVSREAVAELVTNGGDQAITDESTPAVPDEGIETEPEIGNEIDSDGE